jgi:hypothetical protein
MLAPNTTTNAALSIEEAVYYRKVFEDSPESLGKSQTNETLTFSNSTFTGRLLTLLLARNLL